MTYGYLDMPEGWSDVDDLPVLAMCVDCGCVMECEGEATWVTDGQRYTACGCTELFEYDDCFEDRLEECEASDEECEDCPLRDICHEDEGWDQADADWASRCDDDEREPRLRDWSEL